jgi:hypothetical protein
VRQYRNAIAARGPARALRFRTAASAAGHISVGEAQLHRPTLTTQSSVLRLIEDNWSLPRIAGSFDDISGTLRNLFDFHPSYGSNSKLYLDPVTGERLDN